MRMYCKTLILIGLWSSAELVMGQGIGFYTKDSTFRNPSYVCASLNYGQVINGEVMPSNGTNGSLGLDFGAIFKRRYVLGLMVDFRVVKDLGSNKKYNNLLNSFNDNYIETYSEPIEEERAVLLKDAMNGDGFGFYGSYLRSWGIMFSPYPNKYGGFMLQVKKGATDFPVYDVSSSSLLGQSDVGEFIDFTLKNKMDIQLTFKPFLFGRTTDSEILNFSDFVRNHFLLSIYYKRVSLNDAKLDGSPLTNFLKQPFFDKHGIDHQVGLKLGIGIYR